MYFLAVWPHLNHFSFLLLPLTITRKGGKKRNGSWFCPSHVHVRCTCTCIIIHFVVILIYKHCDNITSKDTHMYIASPV